MCFLWLAAIGRPPIPHYAVIPGNGSPWLWNDRPCLLRAAFGFRGVNGGFEISSIAGNSNRGAPAGFTPWPRISAGRCVIWGRRMPPATWRKKRWPKNASAPLSGAGVVSLLVGVSD